MIDRHVFCGPMFLGKELDFVSEGYVVVENDRIVDCGEGNAAGAKRRSIVPAFINSHTHVGDYFLREKCLGMTLKDACGKRGVKENSMSAAGDDAIINGMKAAILEMTRTGTCYFSDFREGGIPGIKMLKKALFSFKYRGVHAKIYGRPLYFGEEFLDECDGYGIRSVRADKIDMRPGRSVGIHVCEEKSGELDDALEFRPDFLVHMNSAGEDEIKKAASSKLPIVVCPRSNAYFALNMPDVALMLDSGAVLCLGTDNAMINSLSMMAEMEYMARHFMGKVDAKEILKMATVNPAKVFGWNSGFISKGADANLILLDEDFLKTDHPHATAVLRMAAAKYDVMFGGRYVHYC